MEAINLTKDQEIESIRLKPATNGGCVLSYTIYTPRLQNSESFYDEKTEVYTDEQFEETVLPRILELYKAEYSSAMSRNNKGQIDAPVKASY